MKLRRKTILLLSTIVVFSLVFGTAVMAYQTEGTPFDRIWEYIFWLEDEVEDFQTRFELQQQIHYLEIEIAELRAMLEFLENPWIEGPPGPQGPEGIQGEKGEKGDQGEQGFGFEPIGYFSYSPPSFKITWPWDGYEYDWRIYENELINFESIYEGAATFIAPVILPHRVTITNLTVNFRDTIEEQNLECRLIRHKNGSDVHSLAKVTSTTIGENSDHDEPITNYARIDNINYRYFLKVTIPKNSSPWNLVFRYAIISYEYPTD